MCWTQLHNQQMIRLTAWMLKDCMNYFPSAHILCLHIPWRGCQSKKKQSHTSTGGIDRLTTCTRDTNLTSRLIGHIYPKSQLKIKYEGACAMPWFIELQIRQQRQGSFLDKSSVTNRVLSEDKVGEQKLSSSETKGQA